MVFDANTYDAGQIKIRFNNLIHHFENSNGKYYYIDQNEMIPEDEDISYEINVHDKQYSATFIYDPLYSNDELKDKLVNEVVEENKLLLEKKGITPEEFYSDKDNYIQVFSSIVDKIFQMSKGSVWFQIFEYYGKYYIGIYYDNLINKPNGEDL